MPDPARSVRDKHDLAFASGGGDMGAALREHDWAATLLGALHTWPQSLRTAASMMFNARHPMYVAWGPDLLLFYNDGCRGILGRKAADPHAVLGMPFREVWSDVWNQVGPMFDATWRGESLLVEDQAFTLARNGFPEQMYASFSTSPIRGEAGDIAGVLCVCSETTAKVRSQQERDRALDALATSVEKLRIATDGAELGMFEYQLRTGAMECSARARQHFGLPREGALSGAMLLQAVHPDDRARVAAESRAVLAAPPAQERYQMEYRTLDPASGALRWIATCGASGGSSRRRARCSAAR